MTASRSGLGWPGKVARLHLLVVMPREFMLLWLPRGRILRPGTSWRDSTPDHLFENVPALRSAERMPKVIQRAPLFDRVAWLAGDSPHDFKADGSELSSIPHCIADLNSLPQQQSLDEDAGDLPLLRRW